MRLLEASGLADSMPLKQNRRLYCYPLRFVASSLKIHFQYLFETEHASTHLWHYSRHLRTPWSCTNCLRVQSTSEGHHLLDDLASQPEPFFDHIYMRRCFEIFYGMTDYLQQLMNLCPRI